MNETIIVVPEHPPQEVIVLSIPFRVLYVPNEELDGAPGNIDTATSTIKINKDIPYDVQKEALFHELLHAADFATADIVDTLKETDVQRLSSVLFSILRDNPHILLWMIERLPRSMEDEYRDERNLA